MEYQAYTFAGMVLVPAQFLRTTFNEQLRLYESQIEQAKSNGLSRGDYVHTVLDKMVYDLSPKFEVSMNVLFRRIEFESLEKEIR